ADDQADGKQPLDRFAGRPEAVEQLAPAGRRIADAEARGGRTVDAPPLEVAARGFVPLQLRLEPGLGLPEAVEQLIVAARGPLALLAWNLDAQHARQRL